jgi:hypothetical protein
MRRPRVGVRGRHRFETRPHLLKEAPVAFKRRNLFVDSTVGNRV